MCTVVYSGAAPGCEVSTERVLVSDLTSDCEACRGQVPVVPGIKGCVMNLTGINQDVGLRQEVHLSKSQLFSSSLSIHRAV